MPFTPEQDAKIRDVLLPKITGFCPGCARRQWRIVPDLYTLNVIQVQPGGTVQQLIAGQPVISLVCENCGNVQLFNVFAVGLAEFFGFKIEAEEPAKKT